MNLLVYVIVNDVSALGWINIKMLIIKLLMFFNWAIILQFGIDFS